MQFWHNPRCRKSREALALLTERGVDLAVREYLKDSPTVEEIHAVMTKLGVASARDMMRTGEADYKDQNLKAETDEAKLIKAMADTPKLIERPILITSENAVIGRPPEQVLNLI